MGGWEVGRRIPGDSTKKGVEGEGRGEKKNDL